MKAVRIQAWLHKSRRIALSKGSRTKGEDLETQMKGYKGGGNGLKERRCLGKSHR